MIIEDLIKKILKEATSDGGGRGSYILPMQPGIRFFKKDVLAPFTDEVSHYDSPLLQYDSYDGKMDETKKQVKKIEKKAEKITNYIKKHPLSTFSDDDGNNINANPGKNKKLGIVPIKESDSLYEDLAVWFGKKKKPKGSSQPKGPWVDICRKVDGKHPPCGRSDASEGSYPKCRVAGVAGKMSDSEKRNACQQKRRAEKNDPQSGKGQKPIMVSNRKKTNENMKRRIITLNENDITRIVRRVLKESNDPIIIPKGQKISLICKNVRTKEDKLIEGDVEAGQTTNANWGYRATIEDPTLPPGSGKYINTYIEPEEFIHRFSVETSHAVPGGVESPFDVERNEIYIEPVTDKLAEVFSEFGVVKGDKILSHMTSGAIKILQKVVL
jgi:hypothetical protein